MSRTHKDNGTDSGWDTSEKKKSFRKVRSSEKEFCIRVKKDNDAALEYDVVKQEPVWGRHWSGYWRPMRRWLDSHVGENWNQVYSELIAKLKTFSGGKEKTLRQYVIGLVEVTPDPRFGDEIGYNFHDFYVDDNGILQRRRRKTRTKTKQPKCNVRELTNWIGGRVIGKVGGKLYWFLPVTKNKKHGCFLPTDKWKCQWGYSASYIYYRSSYGLRYLYLIKESVLDEKGTVIEVKDVWKEARSLDARQHRKFTVDELAYWNKIPKFYQDNILKHSPENKKTTAPGANPSYW